MAAARFIGLTGAIASGKSEALAALARLGAAALSSDAVVHDLLTSERVRDLLVGRWGPTVAPNGEVDRGRVSEVVFADPSELDWLEATLHPLVAEEIADERESLPDGTTVAVVEVPLLFETDMDGVFDATISVVAPDETRAERAGARGTLDLENRSRRQLSQEEKAARATYVVINDGSVQDLEAALAELLAEIESA